MLRYNNSLRVLNMRYNHISDEGATGFALGLGQNRTLQHLDLTSHSHSETRVGRVGLERLAAAAHSTNLQCLIMHRHGASEKMKGWFPDVCKVEFAHLPKGQFIVRRRRFLFWK